MQTDRVARLKVGHRLSVALGVFSILYLGLMLARIALTPEGFLVNFRMYYWTAVAHGQGVNTYDPEAIARVAGVNFMHPFLYPPFWVHVFRPFALFSYPVAAGIFLCVKALALAALLALWTRAFLRQRFDGLFLFICLIGFDFALTFDLESGNTSLFAVLGLWAAFWCYREGKWGLFLVLLMLSASMKLTPLFFLVLLLPIWRQVSWPRLILTTLPFGALVAVSVLRDPAAWRDFLECLRHVPGVPTETSVGASPINFVSALGAIHGALAALNAEMGVALPAATPKVLYVCFALCIAGTAAWIGLRRYTPESAQWREEMVVLASLCYLLLLPRANLYDYVLVLLPAYYAVSRIPAIDARVALLLVAAVSPLAIRPFGFDLLVTLVAPNFPLLLTLGAFLLLVVGKDSTRTSPPGQCAS